jgi:hypothetical protein
MATSTWDHRTEALSALAEAGELAREIGELVPGLPGHYARLAVALTGAVVHALVSVSLGIEADRP